MSTLALRQMTAIAKITMLEGARKQVFHVLMLFAMSLIAISTLLGVFDHTMLIKFVKDLCVVSILVSSGIIAITLSVSALPGEIESRTAYPVLAKPMARWKFVVGKYLGVLGTVTVGMVILLVAFCGILLAFGGGINGAVFLVMPYLLLEAAILAAVAMCLSTVCSPPLAWFVSMVIYIVGNAKFKISSFIAGHDHTGVGKVAGWLMSQLLPNLECFSFKDSLVHGIPVSPEYLVQTALYGILYTAFLLTLASLVFNRREL